MGRPAVLAAWKAKQLPCRLHCILTGDPSLESSCSRVPWLILHVLVMHLLCSSGPVAGMTETPCLPSWDFAV